MWALTPDGRRVAAWASKAFLKGQAELFEFVLDDGRSIKATHLHRFLSPEGWKRAVDVAVGTAIATTNLEGGPDGTFDQRAHEVDDDEYRNIAETKSLIFRNVIEIHPLGEADYYDMTVPGLKNYAAQGIWNHNTINMVGDLIAAALFVPPVGGMADALLKPLYCVAGDTIIEGPDGNERIDVLAERGGSFRVWSISPSGQRVAATADFAFKKGTAELFEYTLANGRRLTATAHHRWLTRAGWSEAKNTPIGTEVATVDHSRAASADIPTPPKDLRDEEWVGVGEGPAIEYSAVVSVRSVGVQDFYDMHVPGWVNYSGNGIWSHNTDVFMAFMKWQDIGRAQNLGWQHYFETFCDGSDRAYTLSALIALRTGMWRTREQTTHTVTVADGVEGLYIGQNGFGNAWLGTRIGTTVRDWGKPGRVYVDRVTELVLEWSRTKTPLWSLTIGVREPEDPVMKALEMLQEVMAAARDLGVL